MRTLSESCRNISIEVSVLNDCKYDDLYLIGKPFSENKKVVTFLGSSKFIPAFLQNEIEGVICSKEIASVLRPNYSGGIAITDDPKTAFFEIHNYYAQLDEKKTNTYISPTAIIHPSAQIAGNNVVIGENTIIMANAVIKEGTVIGDNCTIREACIIGTPAFYYYGNGGQRTLVESTGGVVIGNNTELHTHCIVEKGVLGGNTEVGKNTKVDNAVVIGHDTIIGENCTIAGNALFAGGVHIGNDVFIGVSATVVPNVVLGDRALVSAGAIVTKNVGNGEHVSGNFAINHNLFLKNLKSIC